MYERYRPSHHRAGRHGPRGVRRSPGPGGGATGVRLTSTAGARGARHAVIGVGGEMVARGRRGSWRPWARRRLYPMRGIKSLATTLCPRRLTNQRVVPTTPHRLKASSTTKATTILCTIAVLRVNWAEAARRWAHPPRRPAPWPVRLIAARSAARPERCQQHCQRCDHHAPLGHTHVTLPRLKHVGFLLPPATWSSKVCPGRDPRWRSSTTRARPAWRPCGAAPPPCAC